MAPGLDDLDLLTCTHASHAQRAGGEKHNDDVWNSAAAAAYPAELNLILAYAIAHLKRGIDEPSLLPEVSRRAAQEKISEKITQYEIEERRQERIEDRIANLPHPARPLPAMPPPSHPLPSDPPCTPSMSVPAPPLTPSPKPTTDPCLLTVMGKLQPFR